MMDDLGPTIFNTAVAFLILTWITILLRIYVRAWMLKSFGGDDYLIVLAQVFMTVLAILEILGSYHGFGKHLNTGKVSLSDVKTSLKIFYFAELTYVVCTTLLKMSVGLFLLRIVIKKPHKIIVWSAMGVTVVFFFNWFFGIMFQCQPPQAFWEESPLSKKCLGPVAVQGVTYTATGLTTIVDLVFGILPMFIVKELHAPLKHKIILCFILSLAMIAGIATVIRIPFIKGLLEFQDFLFRSTGVLIWSTVEVGLGIIACSLATLRPLLHLFLLRVGLTTNDSSSIGTYKKKAYGRSWDMSRSGAMQGDNDRPKIPAVNISAPILQSQDGNPSHWAAPNDWKGPAIALDDLSASDTARPAAAKLPPAPIMIRPRAGDEDLEAQRHLSPHGDGLRRYHSSNSDEEIWGLNRQAQELNSPTAARQFR